MLNDRALRSTNQAAVPSYDLRRVVPATPEPGNPPTPSLYGRRNMSRQASRLTAERSKRPLEDVPTSVVSAKAGTRETPKRPRCSVAMEFPDISEGYYTPPTQAYQKHGLRY